MQSDFNGFCGLIIHHTSFKLKNLIAVLDIYMCPLWAGLKDPPSKPMRIFFLLDSPMDLEGWI